VQLHAPEGWPSKRRGPDFLSRLDRLTTRLARVRVVTPILRSGGYVVNASPAQAGGGDRARQDFSLSQNGTLHTTLSTNADLIGYEVSFYSIKPWRGGGVQVIFHSAEINREGQRTLSRQPI